LVSSWAYSYRRAEEQSKQNEELSRWRWERERESMEWKREREKEGRLEERVEKLEILGNQIM
jgi:hypothetical protein